MKKPNKFDKFIFKKGASSGEESKPNCCQTFCAGCLACAFVCAAIICCPCVCICGSCLGLD